MAVFINQPGDNVFTGLDGVYDQVDYTGSLTDYEFSLNNDGTVTVTHPTLGTDTLSSIEGFWFSGEQAWYSLEQALELTGGTTGPAVIFGSDGDDALIGSAINNTFIGSFGDDSIDGNGGEYNQVDYGGSLRDYVFTQNADGSVTVSAAGGSDTLTDIDGFWFSGEQAWYSVAQALELAGGDPTGNTITGTDANDIIIGTEGDDIIEGLAGNDVIFASEGADFVDGGTNEFVGTDRDVLSYANASEAILISALGEGFQGAEGDSYQNIERIFGSDFADVLNTSEGVTSINGGGGNDLLVAANGGSLEGGTGDDTFIAVAGVQQGFFGGSGADTFVLTQGMGRVVIRQFDPANGDRIDLSDYGITDFNVLTITTTRAGLILDLGDGDSVVFTQLQSSLVPEGFGLTGPEVIEGTDGNDFLSSRLLLGNVNNVFVGSAGDDTIFGGDGAYNQVDYEGFASDYVFTRNDNGSIEVSHSTLGTDTLNNIDGIWFAGQQEWFDIDDLIVNPVEGDFIFGTDGQDFLNGDGDVNIFVGSLGFDTIDGAGGSYNQVDYDGFAADYTFTLRRNGDVIVQSNQGTDTLRDIDGIWFTGQQEWFAIGDLISDPLLGTSGNDRLFGTPGDDEINGFDGDDFIEDLNGVNILDGGAGNDVIRGDGLLIGGLGNDQLSGTGELLGGDGDDVFFAGQGNVYMDGGAGIDTLNLSGTLDFNRIEATEAGFTVFSNTGFLIETTGIEQVQIGGEIFTVDDLFGMA